MPKKFYGLLAPRERQTAAPISDDVWIGTVLLGTHIVKNYYYTKVHLYAFIMIILDFANKVCTF